MEVENNTQEKPRARRDGLMKLEKQAQELWESKQFHKSEIDLNKKKYFATFPYPYTNGLIHLGHAYSLTKAEFMIRFKKITGHNVLFSQGFHCTGQPICAAATKLQHEFDTYGNPPKFPPLVTGIDEKTKKEIKRPMFQYEILEKSNVPISDIPEFVNPQKWLQYFPPIAQKDLSLFGLHSDWRRTFITTSANPYYNSFIEWQFKTLKELDAIQFGKRPSIYSILDQQMCADHDRKEGEGVNPQEYVLIKLKLLKPYPKSLAHLEDREIFLVPGTLRAETMFGQTNCFILPTGNYGAFEMQNNEIFICSERSAKNMSYQGITKTEKKVEKVADVLGQDLIGCAVKAPLAQYEKVYVWPMSSISMEKGTGVVTSVPSDAPDDYATLRDLQKKKDFREKYGLTDDMVLPFNPIEIIDIPSYGKLSALKACDEFKVKSMNDKAQLALAKEKTYKLGFYEGVMLVDKYKGMKVEEAKPLVKNELVKSNEAVIYYEPENLVVSRSGDECIVAFVDQWYLKYSDTQWKKAVHSHTDTKATFQCYNETTQKLINDTVDWLQEWGCSRSFGLGTVMPWDKQFLIESLSDSTIYMAYYTVAHYLQGCMNGSEPGILGIKAEEMTKECWDYVFTGIAYNAESMKVSEDKLKQMKDSFNYWYPMDLRTSGKDLIKNHLTMCLFNHAKIWNNQPEKWPKSFFCNGWILVNGEKMSKSLGNFYTIDDCATQFGIDATRFSLACAGDSLDDANFTFENTDTAILRLSTLEMFIKETLKNISKYRSAEEKVESHIEFFDQIFENQLMQNFMKAKQAYELMKHRDVIKYGFFDFTSLKDEYKINLKGVQMRKDLLLKYIELQLLILYPITPHFAEMIYNQVYQTEIKEKFYCNNEYISYCTMPEFGIDQLNVVVLKKYKYLTNVLRTARLAIEKLKKIKAKAKSTEESQSKKACIIINQEYFTWQKTIFKLLAESEFEGEGESLSIKTDYKAKIKQDPSLKQFMKNCFAFSTKLLEEIKIEGKEMLTADSAFDEKQFIISFQDQIKSQLNIEELEIISYEEAQKSENKEIKKVSTSVQPLQPAIIFC